MIKNKSFKGCMTPEILFFVVAAAGIINMLLMLLLSHGGAIERMVYDESLFVDFWMHINRILTYDSMYGNMGDFDAIFPPLAYCFLAVFAQCMNVGGEEDTFEYAATGLGILIFVIYLLVFVVAFVKLLDYDYKTDKRSLKIIAPFIFLFSYPFWGFAFERGNPVLYAMLFLYLGMALRNHPDKIMREISLICVAVSAGFKIYPALFGLLWLAEKRYKEAFRLTIYGLLAFFGPFVFCGGAQGFLYYLTIFSGYIGRGAFARTSMIGTFIMLFGESGWVIGKIAVVLWVCWVVFYIFSEKKTTWKSVALLTSTQTIIIPESYVYTYVFITISCVMFLNEQAATLKGGEESCAVKAYRRMDYLYAILFACIFTVPFLALVRGVAAFSMYGCWVAMLLALSAQKIFRMTIGCPRAQ